MLAGISRATSAAALTAVALLACSPVSSRPLGVPLGSSSMSPLTPTSRVIDAARIARFGSQSALDVVRMLVPSDRLADVDLGIPIRSRGSEGYSSRGRLRIVVDKHPIFDLESLRAISAREILAIHILGMIDAMMFLGPGYEGGAIVVMTQAALTRF